MTSEPTDTAAPAPASKAIPPILEFMEHVPELVQTRNVRAAVQGGGRMGRLNAAIAVRITKIVGTMYCAYVFTLIALVALPTAIQQGSPTVLVNWISSNFLQLVLLPIIIVGQNVISAAQDKRAEADHKTLTALHKMNVQQLKILHAQEKILDLLRDVTVKDPAAKQGN
jgi:hypothetical protein